MVIWYMKNNSLWKEILQLDLSDVLSNVQVPYIILQGDTDFVASTETVEEVVDASKNNNLHAYCWKYWSYASNYDGGFVGRNIWEFGLK